MFLKVISTSRALLTWCQPLHDAIPYMLLYGSNWAKSGQIRPKQQILKVETRDFGSLYIFGVYFRRYLKNALCILSPVCVDTLPNHWSFFGLSCICSSQCGEYSQKCTMSQSLGCLLSKLAVWAWFGPNLAQFGPYKSMQGLASCQQCSGGAYDFQKHAHLYLYCI